MKKLITSAVAALALASANVYAALPAGVSTAITEAGVDGNTVVGYLAVAGASAFLLHKLLKRFGISM